MSVLLINCTAESEFTDKLYLLKCIYLSTVLSEMLVWFCCISKWYLKSVLKKKQQVPDYTNKLKPKMPIVQDKMPMGQTHVS